MTRGSREPVEKSRSLLELSRELSGTSQHMQIVDNGTSAQIEEILAQPSIQRLPSLPAAKMSQSMLNRYPFTQASTSLGSPLTLAQYNEQGFIAMNFHASSFSTAGAVRF